MAVGKSTAAGVGCVRQANTGFNNELLVGDPETEKYKRHRREWRFLKLHIGLSTVLLLFLIVGSV